MNFDQSRPDSVSAALIEILRDDLNIDIGRVTPESRLVDDVGLDSVAFAVGMVAIEAKLGVAVSEQELLGCDTVGDLENVIRAKVPVGQWACWPPPCPGRCAPPLTTWWSSIRTPTPGRGTHGRRSTPAPRESRSASSTSRSPGRS